MRYSAIVSLAGAAFVSSAMADDTVVQVFIAGADAQSLVASVVSANPTSTEFAITCPTGTDSSDCGFPDGINLQQLHSSVWIGSANDGGSAVFSFDCTVNAQATQAACVVSVGGPAANDPGVATSTLSGTDVQFFPVTVTAGQQKLGATGGSVPTGSTGSSASGSASGSAASGSKPTGASTMATASASSTSSGAAPSSSAKSAAAVGLSKVSVFGLVSMGVFMAGLSLL